MGVSVVCHYGCRQRYSDPCASLSHDSKVTDGTKREDCDYRYIPSGFHVSHVRHCDSIVIRCNAKWERLVLKVAKIYHNRHSTIGLRLKELRK